MAWLMRTLPRQALLLLCKLVGLVAFLLDSRGRTDGVENVRVAFDDQLSWWQCHRIVLASYQNFARTFADLFWVKTVTQDRWQDHFTFNISPAGQAEMDSGKGSIWVTPHYGNFELSSIVLGYIGRRYTIVAQDFKNSSLTAIFSEARGVTGHRIIPRDGAMLRLVKELMKGGTVAFLSDLNVKPDKAAEIIESFGRKISVTKIHVTMARRLKLAIQPAVCRPLEDGRYEMVVFDPIYLRDDETDTQAVQRIWNVFENEIRQHPQWWMWMYKHWRYKPKDTGGIEYPCYANESWSFEKMVT